jgi:putative ABC transport system permease protein
MSVMMGQQAPDREGRDPDTVYSNNIMTDMMESISAQMSTNDLERFKAYLEGPDGRGIADLANTIEYGYDLDLQIYRAATDDGVLKVNPSDIFSQMTGVDMAAAEGGGISPSGGGAATPNIGGGSNPAAMMNTDIWSEMIGNQDLLRKQYEVLAGAWPQNKDEVVVVVDENNELSDVALYSLGILDQDQLVEMFEQVQRGEEIAARDVVEYSYDDLLDLRFKLVLNTDVYAKEDGLWVDKSASEAFMKPVVNDALELKVVGVLRPNEGVEVASIGGSVAYTGGLDEYVVEQINASEIVQDQEARPETNVLTGLPFDIEAATQALTMEDVTAYIATLPEAQQGQMAEMLKAMPEDEILTAFGEIMRDSAGEAATYEDNLERFGVVDLDKPSSISIYPKDFEAKEGITERIEAYNAEQEAAGHEEYTISYSDLMAVLMSSVTSIMNIITYVLIAFVAISLVVSSIMIGIITYISVLERTKEIGVLRSIGASKRDISRVFNAETVIEGFVAGGLGIGITLLLNIPINLIIKQVAGVAGIASLPVVGAVALIALSVVLTVVAGLLPSRVAAKKDPVEALRTE